MTNERYKELMAQVGMPNSRSLLAALQQAVNETQQKEYKKAVLEEREAIFKDMEEFFNCDDPFMDMVKKGVLETIRSRGEEMNKWISVKDKLFHGRCLTYGIHGMEVGVWDSNLDHNNEVAYFTDGDVNWPVTHWIY